MSMNLVFVGGADDSPVPFPFQTPTTLTYAVLRATTIEQRVALIRETLVAWQWDATAVQQCCDHCEKLMHQYRLSMA
jgi:hypothetical protein